MSEPKRTHLSRNELIMRAYQAGATLRQIADAAEINISTVRMIVYSTDVPRRQPHRHDLTPEIVLATYRQHGSLERTAEALNCAVPTVRKRLRDGGYSIGRQR
jgi:DNA-binding CsgD family transcriptional regulator